MRKVLVLLCVTLFLAGCVDVQVKQKLYQDGTMDVSLAFISNSSQVLSGFKGLPVHSSVKDRYVYEETSTSITYAFTRVDLQTEQLFDVEGKDLPIFARDSYSLTKDSGFPFTYYTYEFQPNKGIGSSGNEQAKALFSVVKMQYDVEVFGTITETTGTKQSDNVVSFTVDLANNELHSVTFKKWFFTSWFS
jgi:hypothetical protein